MAMSLRSGRNQKQREEDAASETSCSRVSIRSTTERAVKLLEKRMDAVQNEAEKFQNQVLEFMARIERREAVEPALNVDHGETRKASPIQAKEWMPPSASNYHAEIEMESSTRQIIRRELPPAGVVNLVATNETPNPAASRHRAEEHAEAMQSNYQPQVTIQPPSQRDPLQLEDEGMRATETADHDAQTREWVRKHNNPLAEMADAITRAIQASHGSPRTDIYLDGTARAMMARQTVAKDLPVFSGDAFEWPIFISQLKQSTQLCDLSPTENMLRLQKALKGKAKTAVECLLHDPSNYNTILDTLELRFGHPEIIVARMLERVRRLPRLSDTSTTEQLLDFSVAIRNIVATVQGIDDTYLASPQLLNEMVTKMPLALRMPWLMSRSNTRTKATITELSDWLMEQCYKTPYAGLLEASHTAGRQDQRRDARVYTQVAVCDNSMAKASSKPRGENVKRCIKCQENHELYQCKKFRELSHDERWNFVKIKKLCFQCLRPDHRRIECLRNRKCGLDGCTKNHDRLLHRSATRELQGREQINTQTQEPTETFVASMRHSNEAVLLKVIPVAVHGPLGKLTIYALLDEGSSVTLIDNETSKSVGATGPITKLSVHGTLGMCSTNNHTRRVKLNIKGDKNTYAIEALSISHLDLPVQPISGRYGNENVKPQMLIGQDNAHLIVSRKVITKGRHILSRTALGWTLHGGQGSQSVVTTLLMSEYQPLHEIVRRNFAIDSLGVAPLSRENTMADRKAHEIMSKTTRITAENRWETGLLWENENSWLPENRICALRRLQSLERKFEKNTALKRAYQEKMADYVQKGYARERTPAETTRDTMRRWYLPHFAVTNQNKPGKIRVVFDAASRCAGKSLNDLLMTGPDLLTSLFGNILRFREGKIALSADIKEMFLQIKIIPEDQQSQLFLWRDEPQDPVRTMVLTSMSFGAKCSPSSAQYVRNRVAALNQDTYPVAAAAIREKFYMDDYLDATDNLEDARKLVNDVTNVLKTGGFQLTNWASNFPQALDNLPHTLRYEGAVNIAESDHASQRILGVRWLPASDCFVFGWHEQEKTHVLDWPTKRELLSEVMKVFDPTGFISCLTIRSKILLQEVWRSKIDWDERISEYHRDIWQEWVGQLRMSECAIPRCMRWNREAKIYLHIFCDASELACCTVAYRAEVNSSAVKIAFVASKCKVAPLKPLSIPRLELQAALMGARLAKTIQKECSDKNAQVIYWSDSRTVLSWIRSDPLIYSTFVANRLGEIDDLTTDKDWRWVPSSENPADIGTRNVKKIDLSEQGVWFSGPTFLKRPPDEWPIERAPQNSEENDLEIKTRYVGHISEIPTCPFPDARRFSSRKRLIRATAWIMRFVHNLRTKKKRTAELTSEEINLAEIAYIKYVQKENFATDITKLLKELPLARDSRLLKLSPRLDESCMLRMNTRLTHMADVQEPIILDGQHPYTRLLVANIHEESGHCGVERTVANVREEFYILGLRRITRKTIHDCQRCKNERSKPIPPRMAPLPAARLEYHKRPFTHCGLDLFGPMTVTVGRRREKRYGALFTCMSTRAIHLELIHNLSSDSTIMAIRRMTARRGQPRCFYSDNGTNFHGANREIARATAELQQDTRMKDEMATKRSEWRFIPPASPHMGGAWEALVKSVKKALETSLKERSPKDETLRTALAEAEHTVNSRPLTHISMDPGEDSPLTPNHFLIGGASGRPHLTLFGKHEEEVCLRKQWKQAQQLADAFWRRWLKEYLPTLARRQKWHTPAQPIQVGNIAVITDPNLPRNNWPKGVITAVSTSPDGQTRVVRIKTNTGEYMRPTTRIAVLPVTTA